MSAADLELPSGWLSLTLGEVISYGSTEKAEPEDLLPETWVLELEDVEKGTTKILTRLTYSDRQSKSTKNVFYAGDVLYGKLRPYLNKIVFADSPGVCTTEIVPIRPNVAVRGKYLFYWLRHPLFLQYVTEVSHGVNMPRLGTDAGRQAPFVLAPEKEQTRIADKLDTVLTRVDAVNTRLARVAPLLKRFRQSVLAAAVSGRLTEEWRASNPNMPALSMEELELGIKSSGFRPKAKGIGAVQVSKIPGWLDTPLGAVLSVRSGDGLTAKEMNEGGTIPVYGGNGINGYHTEGNVTNRTVVIGRVGYYCGSVHFTPNKAWVTDNALVVNLPNTLFDINYIYWLLLGTNLRENTSSSAQPVISGEKIYPIKDALK